ncbi:Gfo/Idh/MocA family oxidoreductase [Shewanella sp. VB17]|uniref:Gfo/Idh/MocA family oxidoreductase n=1 Tax=Shewanella sp. VB17 TaxID=2739432 RepID=UPI0015674968|nr:Gfo/Idh/MocA family oxidoreductase [Shewanella sp. VB17]NRD75800.1 Gfo/Idh/MocA family oxidoreductase [Shewanella sp. VB17]
MQYIQIGYGNIAPLHIKKLQKLGATVIGVIETNTINQQRAIQDGFQIIPSYFKAAEYKPDFWDICTPTDNHLDALKSIILTQPNAAIIIEKPVCHYTQLDELKLILSTYSGKLVVNENYFSSRISSMIKAIVCKQGISIKNISIEMSKNRLNDFKRGRFIDTEFGAIGYEGPHMLALCYQLGREFLPKNILNIEDVDLYIPFTANGCFLAGQSSSLIHYQAHNDVSVELYTSLEGHVRNHLPIIYGLPQLPKQLHGQQRHRIMSIKGINTAGDNINIIGLHEPILGCKRAQGIVAVEKNGICQVIHRPLFDDSMYLHLHRTLKYFQGQGKNPTSIQVAVDIVKSLGEFCHAKELA